MFEKLHRWAIEVDQNHVVPNFKAQRIFIREFGNALYSSLSDTSSPLSTLRYIYFTRIFYPQRDNMGAYVRLHFFVDDSKCAAATVELDKILEVLTKQKRVFQIKKEIIDGIKEAELKEANNFPELYYHYMHSISQIAVKLFDQEISDELVEKILGAWRHNLYNLLRGYD
jgi:hypothetical protein